VARPGECCVEGRRFAQSGEATVLGQGFPVQQD